MKINTVMRNVSWASVSTTGMMSLDQRAALRIAATHAIWPEVQVVDTLYHAAGATGIYEDHALQRAFQDIHVISQHMQACRAHYELVGRYWLGFGHEEARF